MSNNKKTILVLVDWFYPGFKAGGPIQSCFNFSLALKDYYNIKVVTSDTDHGELLPYKEIKSGEWDYTIVPGIGVYYLDKNARVPAKIKDLVEEVQPDWIYLNHLFSPLFVVYPLWLKWRSGLKTKVVLCPRGALFQSALDVKPFKKKVFLWFLKNTPISDNIHFHATNEREKDAILSFFPKAAVAIADNLPRLQQPGFNVLKKEPGLLSIIYASRIHPIKNLERVLVDLRNIKSKIRFTIAGPIEDELYWNKCCQLIKELPANIEVEYVGPVKNDELCSLIQNNHLFVLPTLGENFGHAIFESFLYGRPVLISDQTPWRNLQDSKIGWDVDLASNNSIIDAINCSSAWSQDDFNTYSLNAWKFAKAFIENRELVNNYFTLFK